MLDETQIVFLSQRRPCTIFRTYGAGKDAKKMGHRFARVYTDKGTSGKKIPDLQIDGVYSEVTIEY